MSSKRRYSSSNQISHSAKRQYVEEIKKHRPIETCKQELKTYIASYTSITDQEDFWTFYEKYKLITNRSSNEERLKILNIDFMKNWKAMYERLPMLNGDNYWTQIDCDEFKQFLITVKIYQDFQQKSSFNKLKQLKIAQSDLPIAKYKTEIIENVQKHKVILIAGKYQNVTDPNHVKNFRIFIIMIINNVK